MYVEQNLENADRLKEIISQYQKDLGLEGYELTGLNSNLAVIYGEKELDIGIEIVDGKVTVGVLPSTLPVISVINPLTDEESFAHLGDAESDDVLDACEDYRFANMIQPKTYTL